MDGREAGVSEARFRAFADHVQDAFYLHDADGVVLDVNRRACDMLGYRRDELIGLHPRDFDASDVDHITAHIRSQLAAGREARFDTYHRRKDGGLFPVEVRVFPYEEGGQSLSLALVSDISVRKQAEDMMHQLNRELHAISDCHQVLLRADDERKLLDDICRIICDKTGYRMAWVGFVEHDEASSIRPVSWAGQDSGYIQHVSLTWAEDSPNGQGPSGIAVRSGDFAYVQDISNDPCMAPWRHQALERGYHSSIAVPLKGDDGRVFGVLAIYSYKAYAFSETEIRLLVGLADDLAFGLNVLRLRADRDHAEETLVLSEEKYRTIFENSPLGLFRSNIRGQKYVEVNPALAMMLGYDSPEHMIREVADIGKQIYANPVEREGVVARQLQAPGDVMQHLCRYRHRDGSECIANLYLKTIRDAGGNPVFFEGIVEDITEQVRFEIALQEKSAELHQLNMELRKLSAHREKIIENERMRIAQDLHDELGQNLTALLMNLSTLEATGGDLSEGMIDGLDHARRLVEKSMNKAREIVAQLRPKSIDIGLSASIEGLIDSYFSSTGIQCELELIEWDDALVNDAATVSLYRVAQESLTNVARYAQTDNVTIVLSGRDDACQLIVRDEGIGFDPNRIKENSFGLLGIRERIANLGGSFVVDAQKGKGTELRVTLPACEKRKAT